MIKYRLRNDQVFKEVMSMRMLGKHWARLSTFTTVTAIAVTLIGGATAHAGQNGTPCTKNLPTERFVEVQRALHVTPDGKLGWETCSEVLDLHDVLIESETIPATQRGVIGWKTYEVLLFADDGLTSELKEEEAEHQMRCQLSRGYEHVIRQLQAALGVTVDGWIGSETCGALLAKQQPWVSNGWMSASSLGWIGPLTTDQLGLDTEPSAQQVAPEQASACPVIHDSTERVICIDRHARTGVVYAAHDGELGQRLYSFSHTASLEDRDGPGRDAPTVTGSWMLYGCQEETSSGLELYCEFYKGQGIHFYPYVGPNYDSTGCVRVTRATAEWLWQDLQESGRVDRNVVEVAIS